MTEATTSNTNWRLLARTLCRGHVDNSLLCRVAWLHKRDVFLGVLRAQRFKHTTSHEASPLSLGFPCHLSAPIPDLPNTIPPKCHNLTQDRRFRGATTLNVAGSLVFVRRRA
jgi:hypothetical protein